MFLLLICLIITETKVHTGYECPSLVFSSLLKLFLEQSASRAGSQVTSPAPLHFGISFLWFGQEGRQFPEPLKTPCLIVRRRAPVVPPPCNQLVTHMRTKVGKSVEEYTKVEKTMENTLVYKKL